MVIITGRVEVNIDAALLYPECVSVSTIYEPGRAGEGASRGRQDRHFHGVRDMRAQCVHESCT